MLKYAPLILLLIAIISLPTLVHAQAPNRPYTILAEYPHDTYTSTQGLFFHNGLLYESSGGYGNSFLAIVQPDTGQHVTKQSLDHKYFAEGITPNGNTLYALTWQSGTGFTYDLETLEPRSSFRYRPDNDDSEGWGITSNDTHFILSSGTAQLTFHRPEDFARITAILVRDGEKPVRMLNELEYVEGFIFANVWKSDKIAIINPKSGQVIAWLDLTPLRQKIGPKSGTANGIAYDKATSRLFITGKHWDKLFVLKLGMLGE